MKTEIDTDTEGEILNLVNMVNEIQKTIESCHNELNRLFPNESDD